jgi:hypothetical protein
MKKQTKTILLTILGVIGVLCLVFVATAVVFFRSAIQNTRTNQDGADRAFEEVIAVFKGQTPLLEIRQGEVVVMRDIPTVAPPNPVSTLHVLAWEPGDESLSRFQLPMWLVRMSDDPIAMQVGDKLTVEPQSPPALAAGQCAGTFRGQLGQPGPHMPFSLASLAKSVPTPLVHHLHWR